MHVFYQPDISLSFLPEGESKHCVKVLRLRNGASIYLIDGKGLFCKATITDANHKKCAYSIEWKKEDYEKNDWYIHVAIAPTKNFDKTEFFIEKCVELGINEITFLHTSNSERKIVKLDRANKVALSAAKQSKKAYLPIINELVGFNDFVNHCESKEKFIAHLIDDNTQQLKDVVQKNGDYCILIGPEGDFTTKELELAMNTNFQPVSLGKHTLRTETAGIVACHTFNLINL